MCSERGIRRTGQLQSDCPPRIHLRNLDSGPHEDELRVGRDALVGHDVLTGCQLQQYVRSLTDKRRIHARPAGLCHPDVLIEVWSVGWPSLDADIDVARGP